MISSNIAIVDSNDQHSKSVAHCLLSFYKVESYHTSTDAMTALSKAPPRLILAAEKIDRGGSGLAFVNELKRHDILAAIPVIFISEAGDMRGLERAMELGLKYLVKPYRTSDLIALISSHVNGGIEEGWRSLPPMQRKALEGSLSIFNHMVEDVLNGTPVSYSALNEPCSALVEVINAGECLDLLRHVREHDHFTFVHSLRTATFLTLFAQAIGLSKEYQVIIASGGLLHDIGNVRIPLALLNKTGPLTDMEMKQVRNHVRYSGKIINAIEDLPGGVRTVVTQHHERLDGSGYPLGLTGEALNQLARIAAISDTFAALTDRRPYCTRQEAEPAIERMRKEMGGHLDTALILKFKEALLDTEKPAEPASAGAA